MARTNLNLQFDNFIKIVRYSVHREKTNEALPDDVNWNCCFKLSQLQGVSGIVFDGITRYYEESGNKVVPQQIVFEWITLCEHIKNKNKLLNSRVKDLYKLLGASGFKCCLLKGQGNAAMYPNPYLRIAGDIDIWVDGKKEDVISFVEKNYPDADRCILHIDYPVFDDVSVELHFTPSFLRHPQYNKRLQRFYSMKKQEQFENKITLVGIDSKISVPTDDFNLVFQLSHMFRHFFNEGIGLRHMIDYYYLLIKAGESIDKPIICKVLKNLGLYRFAKAVMWIMYSVLEIEEQCLITPVDEKGGKLLLKEMMVGGDFGKADQRFASRIKRSFPSFSYLMRNAKFAFLFPNEALVAPFLGKMNNWGGY